MQVVHRILYHVTVREGTQPNSCFHVLNLFLFKRKFVFSYSTDVYAKKYFESQLVYDDLNYISVYEICQQYYLCTQNFARFIPIYDTNLSLFIYQPKELCIGKVKGRFHIAEWQYMLNHRMVKVGRYLTIHLVPTLLPWNRSPNPSLICTAVSHNRGN